MFPGPSCTHVPHTGSGKSGLVPWCPLLPQFVLSSCPIRAKLTPFAVPDSLGPARFSLGSTLITYCIRAHTFTHNAGHFFTRCPAQRSVRHLPGPLFLSHWKRENSAQASCWKITTSSSIKVLSHTSLQRQRWLSDSMFPYSNSLCLLCGSHWTLYGPPMDPLCH